ncbi:MAG: mechanosensitive ion channel [Bacteroidia bacterium]|nr:mechanosensitive ion channel [Bacteroidia bacterium]
MPNGKLADMVVDNMGLRRYRRFRTTLAVTYDTPPPLIEAFVEGIRQIIANHPDTRKDYYFVYFNEFNSASLDILFYTFFEVPDWGRELKARHEVMLAILNLAKVLRVRFAFPTQNDSPGGNARSGQSDTPVPCARTPTRCAA